MPRLLLISQFSLDLYDSTTGRSLEVLKVVDVSDVCFFREEGCVLLYGRAQRGPLVQIVRPYSSEDLGLGVVTHYFLNELEAELKTWDTLFPSIAEELGLTTPALVKLLRQHAP